MILLNVCQVQMGNNIPCFVAVTSLGGLEPVDM